MVLIEENISFGIAGSWIACVWFTQLMKLIFLFESSQLVQAAELLILVHTELNIVNVEFMIVALLYLDLLLLINRDCYFGKNSYISITVTVT